MAKVDEKAQEISAETSEMISNAAKKKAEEEQKLKDQLEAVRIENEKLDKEV